MRDHLLDLVSHTLDLGCIDLVKITGDTNETVIAGIAEDRSVVVEGKYSAPVAELVRDGFPGVTAACGIATIGRPVGGQGG